MVTLLALLYAATQRIRVRARTRPRLNYSNRTCAVTLQCASTAPGSDWLKVITRLKAQSGHGREGPNARNRSPQRHMNAHSDVFPFVVVFRGSFIPQHAPHHPADLSSLLHGSVIITIQYITHTGNAEFALFFSFLFFNPINPSGHLVFLSDDEDALKPYEINIFTCKESVYLPESNQNTDS